MKKCIPKKIKTNEGRAFEANYLWETASAGAVADMPRTDILINSIILYYLNNIGCLYVYCVYS